MKILKLLSLLTFAALSLGFTACDDKENDPISANKLVGSWEAYWLESWYKDSAIPEDNEEMNQALDQEDRETITFNKDLTGGNSEENFTWKLNGRTLTITFALDAAQSGKILKLTDSELILEHYEEDGTAMEYTKFTFRRK